MRMPWRSTAALAGLLLGMLLAVPTVAAQAAPAGAAKAAAAAPAAVSPRLSGVCGNYWGTSWPPPSVRRGSVDTSSPSAVMLAQCYLNNSVNTSMLTVDGRFGPNTDRMVRLFQDPLCGNVPPVDGIVGPNTWNALRRWANSPNWVQC
ncbi:MAG TPA: peptidoglycan-binding protein [Mycobacteriales bacterium]|nr:peptidoglycan-binding protein [Mycobacteriales bacterium]